MSLALSLATVINVCGFQGAARQTHIAIAASLPQSEPAAPRGSSRPAAIAAPNVPAAGSVPASASPLTAAAPPDSKLVAGIQRELAARGYDSGLSTGQAGLLTRCAVLAFEFDQHFALTGEISDEQLRRVILGQAGGADDPLQPASATASQIIGGAQKLLVQLGYDPGSVSGQLSEDTRRALRQFEADAGLLPKGRISGEVMAKLTKRAHAKIEGFDEPPTN